MTTGERLKKIRKKMQLTQAAFGEKIGLKPTAIGQMESGTRNITDRTFLLLGEKLNVNEEWLRSGAGEMFIEKNSMSLDEYAKSKNLTSLELDIMRAYMDLDKNTRTKLLNNLNNIFIKHSSDIAATLDNHSISNDNDDIELELAKYRMELESEKKGKTLSASAVQKHA